MPYDLLIKGESLGLGRVNLSLAVNPFAFRCIDGNAIISGDTAPCQFKTDWNNKIS